jgi:hypothetical protein
MTPRTVLACLPGILSLFGCRGAVTEEIGPETRPTTVGAAVFWQNAIGVEDNGNTLTRSTGWGWNAGASSAQMISAGDGFVEFSTSESNLSKMAGLSHGDDDQGYGEIDYAFYLRSDGVVDIYEVCGTAR